MNDITRRRIIIGIGTAVTSAGIALASIAHHIGALATHFWGIHT